MSNDDAIGGCSALVIVLFFCAVIASPFIALNIKNRENGQHTGFITAVETNRTPLLPNNTTTVYVKTELSSSQEDKYCVPTSNSDLLSKLRDFSKTKANVTVTFDNLSMTGLGNCEGDIITGVEPVAK